MNINAERYELNIEQKAREVLRRYPVKRAALFGSAASRTLRESSDIDMLVEFLPGARGLDFFGLKLDLEEALNRPVDLITFRSLDKALPEFKANVEKEASLIYGQNS